MAERDPFEVLELGADASVADVKAARRRLAKELHPDRGGDARLMQELNAAAAAALAALESGSVVIGRPPSAEGSAGHPPAGDAGAGQRAAHDPAPAAPGSRHRRFEEPAIRRGPRWIVEDVPSFVVEALPAVTFELLVSVAPAVGTVLDDDPPYVLDVAMTSPEPCWCRLELLPEAGASTVNLYVGGTTGNLPPTVESVRDVWIAALNDAEWPS